MKKRVLSLVLVVLLIFSTAAFAADETIVEIAVGNGSFTTLVAALQKAELVDTLSGEGPFTVFAPTDDAFADLLAALEITAEDLLNHPQLTDVLLYHVVSGNVMSTDLSDGMTAETLKGDDVTVSLDGGVFINESEVTTADTEGTNGVIHVIDKVLVPDDFVLDPIDETIIEIAVGNGSFTTLVAALQKAELVDTLSGEGPFTVFAPTDDAFADLLASLGITAEDLLNHPQLTDLLLHHVVSGKVMSNDLSDGMVAESLKGDNLNVSINGGVFISGSQVTTADIEGTNGVIHVIDKVLVPGDFVLDTGMDEPAGPSETIVEIAVGNGSFTTLVAALQKAELVGALSGDGPFTVFAPTDAAFADLLASLGITAEDLLNHPQLKDVLLYHVVSGKVMSTDLSDGMMAATLKGDNVTISLSGGVFVNESQVTTADIEGTNGVIHVIDKVLVPGDFVLDSGMEDTSEMPAAGVAGPIGYMAAAALSLAGYVLLRKER